MWLKYAYIKVYEYTVRFLQNYYMEIAQFGHH